MGSWDRRMGKDCGGARIWRWRVGSSLLGVCVGILSGCSVLKDKLPPRRAVPEEEQAARIHPAHQDNPLSEAEYLKSLQGKRKQQQGDTKEIDQLLLGTAKSIERSLGTLAAAQQSKSPPLIQTGPLVTPEGGMGGRVNIDWTGPVAHLLQRVADLTDYRLRVLGKEPAIPVLVSISAKQAVVAEVVQNAALQVGQRAQIVVFPHEKIMELRYVSD